jgi:hypothetical protein
LGTGSKIAYTYLKSSGDNMAPVSENPLYAEKGDGKENPLYELRTNN